jgi:fructosamine-3-kinase
MGPELALRIEALLGQRAASAHAVGGGNIAASWRVRLSSGDECFVKDYGDGPAGLARCEADGLRWLAEGKDLGVAEVLGVADDAPLLVLRWIESAPKRHDFAERLGRGLAALHARGAEGFGHPQDNFIGSLAQSNAMQSSWPRFYAEQRIEPLVRLAAEAGRLSSRVVKETDMLLARLEDLCGPSEPPARLHGDLWSGNLMVDSDGSPCLVDPAVYGGHREIDLAMMQLFGGFEARTFQAYHEAYPLAPGHEERVALYQLYPLAAHVVLFGESYASSFAETVRRYL